MFFAKAHIFLYAFYIILFLLDTLKYYFSIFWDKMLYLTIYGLVFISLKKTNIFQPQNVCWCDMMCFIVHKTKNLKAGWAVEACGRSPFLELSQTQQLEQDPAQAIGCSSASRGLGITGMLTPGPVHLA